MNPSNSDTRPDGWQPIETAAKSRTPIILGNPETPSHQGRWFGERDGFCSDNVYNRCFDKENPPTHWMPLPPSPTSLEVKNG